MGEKVNKPISEETREKIKREIYAYYGVTDPKPLSEEKKRKNRELLDRLAAEQERKRKATEK